jgi:hypothetical protein
MDVPCEPGVSDTIAGLNEGVKLVVDGDTVAVRLTLSVRPKLFSVTVDVPDLPATTLGGLGEVTLIAKSPVMVIAKPVEWVKEPLVPVTVTEYEPAGVNAVVDMVKAEVPVLPGVRERPVVLNDAERPEAPGVMADESVTVPVKPTLATVTADVVGLPATNVPGVGVLELNVKSGVTVIERIEVCVMAPNFAVIVIE